MSKNKFGSYQIGQQVLFNGTTVSIIDKFKGNETVRPNMQSGMLFTGFKSSPCTYLLSNDKRVRGSMLRKIKE